MDSMPIEVATINDLALYMTSRILRTFSGFHSPVIAYLLANIRCGKPGRR